MPKMGKLRVSKLVWDTAIWPRNFLDDERVRAYAEVLKAGQDLPPVVVDRKTKRIVDGVHRVQAYRKVLGEEAVIAVDLRSYATEADLLWEAGYLNTAHGKPLSRHEMTRFVLRGEEMGLSKERLCGALRVTPVRLEELRLVVATGADGRVALKHTLQHLVGEKLTPAQEAYNRRAGGFDILFYINQVIAALESGSVDLERERVRAALTHLKELVGRLLVEA